MVHFYLSKAILVNTYINHPLSAYSICCNPWHPPCSIYATVSLFEQSCPSFVWSTSTPLHFILHTFLHPVIAFFSQHMPIPSQPVMQ